MPLKKQTNKKQTNKQTRIILKTRVLFKKSPTRAHGFSVLTLWTKIPRKCYLLQRQHIYRAGPASYFSMHADWVHPAFVQAGSQLPSCSAHASSGQLHQDYSALPRSVRLNCPLGGRFSCRIRRRECKRSSPSVSWGELRCTIRRDVCFSWGEEGCSRGVATYRVRTTWRKTLSPCQRAARTAVLRLPAGRGIGEGGVRSGWVGRGLCEPKLLSTKGFRPQIAPSDGCYVNPKLIFENSLWTPVLLYDTLTKIMTKIPV